MWRSLVACLNGVQEAGSSNLLTQTLKKAREVLKINAPGLFRVIKDNVLSGRKFYRVLSNLVLLLPRLTPRVAPDIGDNGGYSDCPSFSGFGLRTADQISVIFQFIVAAFRQAEKLNRAESEINQSEDVISMRDFRSS